MSQRRRLLAEGSIGPLALRNRIVLPAMDQNLCDDGELTDANLSHYEERAAAGVGLLIVETSAVMWPVGATSRLQPSLSTDACIPGFTELAKRVHAHGAKIVVQMCHHGKTALVDTADGRVDGQTDGQTDGQLNWLRRQALSVKLHFSPHP